MTKSKSKKKKQDNDAEKEEIGLDEDSLEALTEQTEEETFSGDNGFSEFMFLNSESEEMPTATLLLSNAMQFIPESNEPAQNLEQETSNINIPNQETKGNEDEEVPYTVYNEPRYVGSMAEEKAIDEMRRSRIVRQVPSEAHLRSPIPRISPDDFNELKQRGLDEMGRGEDMEKYRIEPETMKDLEENKLPFEQERKYREFKG